MKKTNSLLWAMLFVIGTIMPVSANYGDMGTLQGTIKSVSPKAMIITTQSPSGTPQEVSVEVNDQTKLTDVTSVNELKTGDQVTVSYQDGGNKKIATSVSKG